MPTDPNLANDERPVGGELERAIRDLLSRKLEAFGAQDIVVVPSSDHDGDPILLVQVKHRLVDRPVNLREVLDADREARDLAWEKGERRFLHLHHSYDDKQKLAATK